MSVVIIGGHDKLHTQYKQVLKSFNCKGKVFTQIPTRFKQQIGQPDFIILFTSTVSHKMVISAVQQTHKHDIPIVRCHTSSLSALKNIMAEQTGLASAQ